jgi:hypothetical protein
MPLKKDEIDELVRKLRGDIKSTLRSITAHGLILTPSIRGYPMPSEAE